MNGVELTSSVNDFFALNGDLMPLDEAGSQFVVFSTSLVHYSSVVTVVGPRARISLMSTVSNPSPLEATPTIPPLSTDEEGTYAMAP